MQSCFDKKSEDKDETVADWIIEKFIEPSQDQILEQELERLEREQDMVKADYNR